MNDERRPAVKSETPSTSSAKSKLSTIVQTKFGPVDMSAVPVAEVVELVLDVDYWGGPHLCWSARVRCPACSGIHQHGAGDEPEPWLSLRTAPCQSSGDYRLALTTDTTRLHTEDAERFLAHAHVAA